jgi:hypothetical protein
MEAQKEAYYGNLMLLLRAAVLSPAIRMAAVWPFAVVGVEAVNRGAADRVLISEKLVKYKNALGQAPPLILKGVLERFWDSRSKYWDDCYYQPCCFVA